MTTIKVIDELIKTPEELKKVFEDTNTFNKVYKCTRNSDGAIGYFKYTVGGKKYNGKSFTEKQVSEIIYTRLGKLFNVPVVDTSIEYLDGIKGVFSKIEADESTIVLLANFTGKRELNEEDIKNVILDILENNESCISGLIDQAIMDVLCFNSDRNTSNLALVEDEDGIYTPYPLFDNEESLCEAFIRIQRAVLEINNPNIGLLFASQVSNYYGLPSLIYHLNNYEPYKNWFRHSKFNWDWDFKDLKNLFDGLEDAVDYDIRKLTKKLLMLQRDTLRSICMDSR